VCEWNIGDLVMKMECVFLCLMDGALSRQDFEGTEWHFQGNQAGEGYGEYKGEDVGHKVSVVLKPCKLL
jgi:hypothetical protein